MNIVLFGKLCVLWRNHSTAGDFFFRNSLVPKEELRESTTLKKNSVRRGGGIFRGRGGFTTTKQHTVGPSNTSWQSPDCP